MLPVAILAGGLATRLYPTTHTIPKSLIDIAGKKFISRQLSYLYSQGIRDVVLCTGHLGHMIEEFVGDGSDYLLNVSYSTDGPSLLGTGGAIRKALPLLGDTFFVTYGDSYLPIDYQRVQQAFFSQGLEAMMTVFKNNNDWDKSNVLFKDSVLFEYNKTAPSDEMAYIDYGLSILSSSSVETYSPGHAFDLADLFHTLSVQRRLSGLEVYDRFYEIGSFSGISQATSFFSSQES